ncbi:MAG TPA: cell division topological specificity factor MinE [Candidatus Acidoferrum sp.]|nr:cell division topological specificity factor MinE [Candidatus Acidoferrum sp.]
MFEFIQRFFGREPSSATAKERLRLVLLSDHLSLAPEVVEALKRDLVDVISRYVEVDPVNCDVTFEQQEKQVAMLANIPIVAMRNRPTPPPPAPPSAPPPARPEPSTALENGAGASASAALDEESEPEATDAPAPQPQPSRRKRRRKHGTSAPAAAPGSAGFSAI